MVALCVASHYRNTPNDLLLLADAPAHRLFVLLGPVDDTVNALPDILAVVQVCVLSCEVHACTMLWQMCAGHGRSSVLFRLDAFLYTAQRRACQARHVPAVP